MKQQVLGIQANRATWRDAVEFKECVQAWAERIGVKPSRVQVQTMTRKWASCSPLGAVTFSTELLSRSCTFGEAVIVHELLHLRVRNHGPLFRSLLLSYLPDADARGLRRPEAVEDIS